METNETKMWLERVKQVLIEEGFRDTLLQIQKPNQIFGLVKKISDICEMHIRGFEDGHLEPEIELSRDYLEHLDDRYRRPAINELTELLDIYNIPYKRTGETQLVLRIERPSTLTEWKPLLTKGITIGIFIGVLYAIEYILDFRHYKNLGTADRLRFATNNALISYQMHLQAFTETRSTLTHHLHTD